MENSIEFLVKFIPEEKYLDNLINHGELFLRPLGYYSRLEKESSDNIRGDIREGSLFNCIRIGSNRPIYCMYSVFENDIIPGGILINKRAIENFLLEGKGFFALINYKDFISQLKLSYFDGYEVIGDIVRYGEIDLETQKKLFTSNSQKSVFVKSTDFSYQQEFRLLVQRNLPMIKDIQATEEYRKTHDSDIPDIYTYTHYTVRIGSLQDFAKKYSIKDLIDYNDDYFILKN
ncbi:MAG: hypothetical protein PHR19_09050 [Bacteroidales bacterium]|nr:hypothetical protein [Bacteroidales bacterium]